MYTGVSCFVLDAMGNAFDKALQEARDFNAAIDQEIEGAALKLCEAQHRLPSI